MTFLGIECWLMYTDEHSDPYFSKIISDKIIVPSIAIITPSDCFVIVNSLDSDNLLVDNFYEKHVYANNSEMWDMVNSILQREQYPDQIYLTYSTINDAQVDVLGHGLYLYITDKIKTQYTKNKLTVDFPSSEHIIYAFFDRKDQPDIDKLKISANRALEILELAFSKINIGMTEKDVVSLVHIIMKDSPCAHDLVVKEDFSWNKDYCPIVLAGPSFTKGGHAMPSDTVIKAGYTLYFDFGVTLTFTDGSKWSSDIQRMGYVLKDNESGPPQDIENMFHTLVTAIEKGMNFIRPGMKGHEVDKIVRNYILEAGYPNYDHSTGHAIGELPHNPGALLGHETRPLANLQLQPNGVYTIEPRIPIENGGSIEEMVLVTHEGGVALCTPQKELYLIRG